MSAPSKTEKKPKYPYIQFGDEKFELDFLENIEREHWVPRGSIKRNLNVVSRDFKRENGKWSTAVKDVN